MDGAVHTYKARLLMKGYTQTLGIDYEETFSPVADIRAIRILITITAFYDYEIWQMNVKTVFLSGYLSEEVYMEQPEGLRVADSRIGNNPEDDFTPLETNRRLCSVFGRRPYLGLEWETSEPKGREDPNRARERGFDYLTYALVSSTAHREGCRASRMSAKNALAIQRCEFSRKELDEFLSSYFIPSEYRMILPHLLRPFLMLLLGTLVCTLIAFLLLIIDCHLMISSVRKHIPSLLARVITHIEDTIVPSKFPQLLLKENMLDVKSFKDKLPSGIEQNPQFQRLAHYPVSARAFDDPIFFLAGIQSS
nr:putative retrotransposon Ty1-copia subclass protein [Tanacetum cinerariifolium]